MRTWLEFRVTTHALRCIDKKRGIDNYLLTTPDEKLLSVVGIQVKRQLEEYYRVLHGKDFDPRQGRPRYIDLWRQLGEQNRAQQKAAAEQQSTPPAQQPPTEKEAPLLG